MKALDFIYNETTISFEPTGSDNVMVNATEMAKLFNKDVFQFTRIDDTKEFIESCLKPQNCGLLGIKTELDLIISKQKSGTWMHRILALKFAAWLDCDFEIWVYTTIDSIILGHYREVKEATFEKLEAERQYEEEKTRLMAKYPELAGLLAKQGLITEAEKKRVKTIRADMDQLKFEFEKNN